MWTQTDMLKTDDTDLISLDVNVCGEVTLPPGHLW